MTGLFTRTRSTAAILLLLTGMAGLPSLASAQPIHLPPALRACFNRDHGKPIQLVPEADIEACYPLAFQFVMSRGWLMPGSYWEYAGNQGSMQWLEYVSSWRLPGNNIECKMVSDGFGFTFRGGIERVRRWIFSPAGLARISDPQDRAKHLADAYQKTTPPCAIGMPQTTQTDVEKMLQRIAAGPAVYQCTPWGRGGCDNRKPRTGTFSSVPNPLPNELSGARAQSYELVLTMFE